MKRNSPAGEQQKGKKKACSSSSSSSSVGRRVGMAGGAVDVKHASEVLPQPTQSQTDKREYRSIRLRNGLTALLISDLRPPLESSSRTCDLEIYRRGSKSHVRAARDSPRPDDAGEEDTSDEEPDDSDEKMAAAALSIGCGSFSEPDGIDGMAHFCEHMVFMGNEKYPEENSFDVFIKNSGGTTNAHTDCEQTQFYFDVNALHLREALDRFAQFFISPLMRQDSMQRERQAVENEYLEALPNDDHRQDQLLAGLARSGHPMAKFTWGNLESLSARRTGLADPQMHARLHQFYGQFYRAPYMTLAVQADQSLDTLQRWVVDIFSEVPACDAPRPSFASHGLPWQPDTFHRLYRIVPVKDRHQVTVTWQLPSMVKHYRTRPLNYISWLMGHEGHGSILAYLKQKMWAVSLVSGNGESGFEHNSAVSCFYVSIKLTDAGLQHVRHVLAAVFGYMSLLRRLGPQQRIYDEIKDIDQMSFRYTEEQSPQDWVQTMADNMQNYEPEDFICGNVLLFNYDQHLIASCQDAMLPSNCNIMLSSRTFEKTGQCKLTEPWFGTKYSETAVPSDWLHGWRDLAALERHFHLPDANPYLARDFSLVAPDVAHTAFPRTAVREPHGELFYRRDCKFCLPRAYVCLRLCSDLPLQSAQHSAMLDLMDNMLTHHLTEELYPAATARLNYRLESGEKGLTIKTDGFSEKLPDLLLAIVRSIAEFEEKVFNSELFHMLKAEQAKAYYNWLLKPINACKDLRMKLLKQRHWMSLEKHRDLLSVTEDGLQQFVRTLRSRLYLQMLVQGNMTQSRAVSLYDEVRRLLACAPLPASDWPEQRVLRLPDGDAICRAASFHQGDTNTMITNFYQWRPGTLRASCAMELLVNVMDEPTFDFLRTRDQLGYHVFAMMRVLEGILAFSISVNTQADKFTPEHVVSRIAAFLEHFSGKLQALTKAELDQIREALIRNKQCADFSLDEEVTRNWTEICAGEYKFDRLDRESETLEKITLKEVREVFREAVDGQRRALSVQVVGCPSADQPPPGTPLTASPPCPDGSAGAQRAHCLPLLRPEPPPGGATCITCVEDFKSDLYLYPVTKITE